MAPLRRLLQDLSTSIQRGGISPSSVYAISTPAKTLAAAASRCTSGTPRKQRIQRIRVGARNVDLMRRFDYAEIPQAEQPPHPPLRSRASDYELVKRAVADSNLLRNLSYRRYVRLREGEVPQDVHGNRAVVLHLPQRARIPATHAGTSRRVRA